MPTEYTKHNNQSYKKVNDAKATESMLFMRFFFMQKK